MFARVAAANAFAKTATPTTGRNEAKCLGVRAHVYSGAQEPRHKAEFKEAVVRAYQDRMSLRGITRTFGVFYKTIIKWAGKKIESLPPLEDTLLPSQKGDVLELDELWSFVQAKWKQCWLWVALCRGTRQIVACTLGDRSQESAFFLREAIPGDYCRRATRSDFWETCEIAFPTRTHRCCGKEEGETNHVERCFGALRARLSRLVRRACSFSKSQERHAEAIHLFITSYNLGIQTKQQRG